MSFPKSDQVTRPAIRYHGGKWKLAPWIIEHFPEHRVYTEAFGGGASVLLRKPRSYAEIYNDMDGEVVNLFRVMRDDGQKLQNLLELTPFARDEFIDSYLSVPSNLEQARRTVIRSFMGFGSSAISKMSTGFRANSSRSGTTPAHDWANYPKALPALIKRLQGVTIENRDALNVIKQHDAEFTLHYVDPPYPHETRTNGASSDVTQYRYEMTNSQHCDLAELLRTAKGMVVVSGYPCDLYDKELYSDWNRVTRKAFADGARERTEVLWLNRACADALNKYGLFREAS